MAKSKGESIQGYFRAIFNENPKLLKQRSNDPLYERWLKDHSNEKSVPDRVTQSLANLKSVLRAKRRRRGRLKQEENGQASTTTLATPRQMKGLDQLEATIDTAIDLAKSLDREALSEIIALLRTARNRVIGRAEGE